MLNIFIAVSAVFCIPLMILFFKKEFGKVTVKDLLGCLVFGTFPFLNIVIMLWMISVAYEEQLTKFWDKELF